MPYPKKDSWKSRLRRGWKTSGWAVLGTIAFAALLLGMRGFAINAAATDTPSSLADRFYLSLGLFVLQTGAVAPPVPWQLQIARFVAPTVAALATARLILTILSAQLTRVRTRRWRGHVVICGLDRVGLHLARAYREGRAPESPAKRTGRPRQRKIVAIEQNAARAEIEECRELGIMILTGDATDPITLRAAGVANAELLFCVCGDDTINGKIAERACDEVNGRDRTPLRCLVGVTTHEHAELIDDIGRHLRESASTEPRIPVDLRAFDIAGIGASAMLEAATPKVSFDGSEDQHFMIVGSGAMGQRLVLEIAERWAVAHPHATDDSRRPAFTLVDNEATRHRQAMLSRQEALRHVPIEAIDGDVGSVMLADAGWLRDPARTPTAIFICLRDDAAGLNVARTLRNSVKHVPIVVRTKTYRGLPSLHRLADPDDDITLFELLHEVCNPAAIDRWLEQHGALAAR